MCPTNPSPAGSRLPLFLPQSGYHLRDQTLECCGSTQPSIQEPEDFEFEEDRRR